MEVGTNVLVKDLSWHGSPSRFAGGKPRETGVGVNLEEDLEADGTADLEGEGQAEDW